ncbi:MAG: LysM domain-containing protein [Salinisphaera sp.]|jgi:hypothetical protein|nr:LysM domain-containing protein [Salinisphaera sp.]
MPATSTGASGTEPLAKRAVVHRAPLHTDDLASHMRQDAPLRYVVKRGDTLWTIAGYYLDDPWYWPQLWDANPGIANPHLIYPGEVLVLTRAMNGQPALSGERTVHLSPRIREQPLTNAIPVIPYQAIRDFLDSPQLVRQQQLDAAPYVVSFDDQHLVAGKGALVYLRGVSPDGPRQYQLVRHDGPYRDATSGRILGQQALPVGQVTITDAPGVDAVSSGVIESSSREALIGDRLLPIEKKDLVHAFYPQAPARQIATHIISVYGGVTAIGQYDVVTLDRGTHDGLARGDVLNVFAAGRHVADPVAGGSVTLPQVYAGQLMVFKAEPRVCFALVMSARRAIHVKDIARSPRN